MLLRKPLPLWIPVSLFAVAVTMTPLASQWLRRPDSSLCTLAEFTARLSRSTPPLYVVPQLPDRPESSMWVCDRPQSREQLRGLVRHPDRVKTGHWRGIVFCERAGELSRIPDDFMHDWGECSMCIGPFVLFGDPDLLQRIRAVILAD